ncbi:hypothetical protein GZ734_001896 [Campylobacter coli]|nr:hypothetical protein [Campylobacter coli]
MNCFKKLKEKIILIKIEKEKASEEKFLKECEIKEAEIRMEILEKKTYTSSFVCSWFENYEYKKFYDEFFKYKEFYDYVKIFFERR